MLTEYPGDPGAPPDPHPPALSGLLPGGPGDDADGPEQPEPPTPGVSGIREIEQEAVLNEVFDQPCGVGDRPGCGQTPGMAAVPPGWRVPAVRSESPRCATGWAMGSDWVRGSFALRTC